MHTKIYCMLLLTGLRLIGAASSSVEETQRAIPILINGTSYQLNRDVLIHIPYFNVLLEPSRIGNFYYNLDYDYATAGDQYNMSMLPKRNLLHEISQLSQNIRLDNNIQLTPNEEKDVIALYNLMSKISHENLDDQSIINILRNSSININSWNNIAHKLLSIDSVRMAFDTLEIENLKQTLVTQDGISGAFFAPAQDMLEVILTLIKAEKTQILVACHMFNNPNIIDALSGARRRGVDVQIIIDDEANRGSQLLSRSNLPFCKWRKERTNEQAYMPKMHNKFFIFSNNIFGQPLLMTGSANCTTNAQEHNTENMIVTNNAHLIAQFRERFQHLLLSAPCTNPAGPLRAISLTPTLNLEDHAYLATRLLRIINAEHRTYTEQPASHPNKLQRNF